MKKLILPLSLVLLGFPGFSSTASAQRYEEQPVIEGRYEGPRISINRGDGRDWDGGDGRGWDRGGRQGSIANDLNRLNREVRQVRDDVLSAGPAGRRVRGAFREVYRGTERLNEQFRRRSRSPWEIRRRTEELRYQLNEIRRELRFRDHRRGDWR